MRRGQCRADCFGGGCPAGVFAGHFLLVLEVEPDVGGCAGRHIRALMSACMARKEDPLEPILADGLRKRP